MQENTQKSTERELTFKTMLEVLKKHALWIGILALVVAIGVGVLTAVFVPTKYVGTSTFWVNNVSEKGDYVQSTMVSASAALAANYKQVVTQKVTFDRAITEYKLDEYLGMTKHQTLSYLEEHVSSAHEEDSVMFDIIVTDTAPARARHISEAIFGVLPDVIAELNTKLADTEKEEGFIKPVQWITDDEEIEVRKPSTVTNALIGGVATFVVLYAIALLLTMLDTVIYDETTLKENFDIPVIGTLPSWDEGGKRKKGRGALWRILRRSNVVSTDGKVMRNYEGKLVCEGTPFAIREAFKHIRTNISYSKLSTGTPAYVITSNARGVGKSTISCNLALTFAETGKRTLLIETDMRCPAFASILGLDGDKFGLSELLTGIAKEPSEVIVKEYRENLDVITSGHIPPNPSELLAQDKLQEYLQIWREEYDMILMDAPPYGEVVDAGVYASIVDGYVLVARSEYSDIGALRSTVQSLENLDTPILGFVVNDVQPKRDKKYGYSYGYATESNE